jgi:hypothetical protein
MQLPTAGLPFDWHLSPGSAQQANMWKESCYVLC